jgi:phage gpG-like protein
VTQFKIVTQGASHAASVIEHMGERAANPRPALEEIYLTALDIIDENFEAEGARGGHARWADNLLTTLIWKARKGYDPRILRATGELKESMTTFRHPEQYSRIERYKIVLSSRLLRGKLHQRGYGVVQKGGGRTAVPARPYIRFTQGDARAFAREIARFLTKGIA